MMTFGEYFEILVSTGLFGKSAPKLVRAFLASSGACLKGNGENATISDRTISAWLNGERNFKTERYFPDGNIDTDQLIKFFRRKINANKSWEIIQQAFLSQKQEGSLCEDYQVDLQTNSRDKFIWSLINQFQMIIGLPESKLTDKNSAAPVTVSPKRELSPGELRHIFLQLSECYGIMDIINRDPPNFNRHDSAALNVFARQIDSQIDICYAYNNPLYIFINSFSKQLQIQTMTLEFGLNHKYSWGCNKASAGINMENGEAVEIESEDDFEEDDLVYEIEVDDDDDYDDYDDSDDDDDDDDDNNNVDDYGIIWNKPGIPELSEELIAQAADKLRLADIYFEEWEDFCMKMNILYNCISSWQDKT